MHIVLVASFDLTLTTYRNCKSLGWRQIDRRRSGFQRRHGWGDVMEGKVGLTKKKLCDTRVWRNGYMLAGNGIVEKQRL